LPKGTYAALAVNISSINARDVPNKVRARSPKVKRPVNRAINPRIFSCDTFDNTIIAIIGRREALMPTKVIRR
jgi:hypothetical protein